MGSNIWYISSNNNYPLMHYGVKLQKWGIRRYQNKDGTLTELGKARLRTQSKGDQKVEFDDEGNLKTDAENLAKARSNLMRQSSEDYGNISKLAGQAQWLTKSIENVVNSSDKKYTKSELRKMKKIVKNMENMSDDELRANINRINLENSYKNIAFQSKGFGKNKAEKYENLMLLLGVAGSAAGIAETIYKLKR